MKFQGYVGPECLSKVDGVDKRSDNIFSVVLS